MITLLGRLRLGRQLSTRSGLHSLANTNQPPISSPSSCSYSTIPSPPQLPPTAGKHNADGTPADKPPTAFELKLAAAKEQLRWRQPYGERAGEWYTKFKVFGSSRNEADNDMIAFMQQPLEISPAAWRAKRERKRISDERFMQQFVPERHQTLGNDLAAAHFLVYRGAAVKFEHSPRWIRRNDDDDVDAENAEPNPTAYDGYETLPSVYDKNWRLEAIRCDGIELYYEGLENVRRLPHLKFLSLHGVGTFDDWCLDRVSGSELSALEVLDVSGTAVTERGLAALYRLPTLRMMVVDDVRASRSYELTCAMLQELMPELKVVNSDAVH